MIHTKSSIEEVRKYLWIIANEQCPIVDGDNTKTVKRWEKLMKKWNDGKYL